VAATAELERSFKRSDFAALRVAGQFNLGFILAVLGDDLFIVDQHASDEIYNFERLKRTTCLNKQPLIAPQPLQLTAAEEQTVLQHADTFRANGFDFEEVPDAGAMPRLRLTAVPFSKNTTFGVADVQELLALLEGGAAAAPSQAPAGPFGSLEDGVVRPSRVRAMLAMRACRCSIMIGRALDTQQARRLHVRARLLCDALITRVLPQQSADGARAAAPLGAARALELPARAAHHAAPGGPAARARVVSRSRCLW
jgi:DNA mismatch repair protein PMS2